MFVPAADRNAQNPLLGQRPDASSTTLHRVMQSGFVPASDRDALNPILSNPSHSFVRACDAYAHNPFVQPVVQLMPVTPPGVQEIPPTWGVGGAGAFAAPVG